MGSIAGVNPHVRALYQSLVRIHFHYISENGELVFISTEVQDSRRMASVWSCRHGMRYCVETM